MTVISLNAEGVTTNTIYLQNLIKKYNPDVIAIQEHWLFNFEQEFLKNIHPDYDYTAKSVDDNDKIPATQRPRGYGGVCILWKKSIPAKKLPDGSERTIALQIGGYTLVNTYLPCRGGKGDVQEFNDELDQLNEVCIKYSNTSIILTGDMNVDLKKHAENRVSKFSDFTKAHSFIEASEILEPTYYHHGGSATSKIDYILIQESKEDLTKCEYRMLPATSVNTSPHRPLLLKMTDINIQATTPNEAKAKYRVLWHKGSPEQYQSLLEQYLEDTVEVVDADKAIEYLITAMQKATSKAFPTRKVKQYSKPKPWSENIQKLLQQSKEVDKAWKEAGSPGSPHPLFKERNEIRYSFRSAQRIQKAVERENRQNNIMSASADDSALFHKLIRQQRGRSTQEVNELLLNNVTHTEDLLTAWTDHFSSLAQPQKDPNFDDEFLAEAEKEVQYLTYLCEKIASEQIPITVLEVQEAIKKLKKKKAQDDDELAAEHIIYGGRVITEFITKIINCIIKERSIPQKLKTGILHPVHKKDKAINIPGNFRGITIISIIAKILDIIRTTHQKVAIPEDRLDVQFGFTEDRAPAHATLLLNEAIAEARDTKSPLYIASLDIQKAFDVVPHTLLLRKLFHDGLPGSWWLLKKNSYEGMSTKVIWHNTKGEAYDVLQGIIQGGHGSTSDFKESIHDSIDTIVEAEIGFHIGSTFVGALACADDVVLIASSETEMQKQIMLFNYFTNRERFKIHPTKTTVSIFNPTQHEIDHYADSKPWKVNGEPTTVTNEFTHLGVNYNVNKPSSTANDTTDARLKTGRNTTYSLMGAGMHGVNGVKPTVSVHMYNIYVSPRVTYGLEFINIGTTNIRKLETAHRSVLRNIQSLPKRTAIPALHILLGVLPIQAVIEQKQMSAIVSLANNDTILDVIIRQLASKSQDSHSWVISTQKLLHKYQLPNFLEIISSKVEKCQWKENVKKAVFQFWKKHIETEAQEKSTLQYLNPLFNGKAHSIWTSTTHDSRDVKRANVKVKMLTGTYILQATKAAFNQTQITTCPLCNEAEEDMVHFTVECKALEDCRQPILEVIKATIPLTYQNHPYTQWQARQTCQLVLDPTHPSIQSILPIEQRVILEVEKLSRVLCYRLHAKRCKILDQTP